MIYEEDGRDVFIYDENKRMIASFNLDTVTMRYFGCNEMSIYTEYSDTIFWFNPIFDDWKVLKCKQAEQSKP